MRSVFLTALLSLIIITSTAQAPLAINYQAVARTSTGVIIPSQNINVRFSVIEGTINGTVIYTETHQTTTSSFGLFTLAIGRGTPVTGTFAGINWGAASDKFLRVEIAPDGSSNYQLQGTTQLLSVPYALYSERTRLIAGNGISVTNGNTIASTYWVADVNGIRSVAGGLGNVGIRTNTIAPAALVVQQQNTGGNSVAVQLQSNDSWHTALTMIDSSAGATNRYTFSLGGSSNIEVRPNNFGILNHNGAAKWAFIINGTNNNIGIGMQSLNSEIARSRLHVFAGDVNIEQIGSGIIMKSPNGQCWRITIDNTGNLVRTAITCP